MRTTADRIRHSLLLEFFALLIITPLGALVFGVPMFDFGTVALVSSMVAMLWNYAFNIGFDRAMFRATGGTAKSLRHRVLHAVLFEAGLLALLVPFIAWHLGVTLWVALAMDVSLAGFFLVYTFLYNIAYDAVFPIPPAPASPKA
ncbi:PACE efflux transporter [Psychromarinibacter sp. S121]|uniref:PACE efflux transporter n=1 Tax=Psychromarinibacter sp. S121 TaxID=3415127 RepID=UPI003C7EC97D